jgi:hypothetical protein
MQESKNQRNQLSTDGIRIEIVKHPDYQKRHIDAWNRILLNSVHQPPTLCCAWVKTYFESRLLASESGFCAFAHIGDLIVGVFPFVVKIAKIFNKSFSQLQTPFDDHTYMGDMIIKEGYENSVASAILEFILCRNSQALKISIRGVTEGSPTRAAILNGLGTSMVHVKHIGYGSYIDTTGDYEQFRSNLKPNFKANLRKADNKFRKLNDVKVEFMSLNEINKNALSAFFALEASGWKGKQGTAINYSSHLIDFYNALARNLILDGLLELHFLMIGSKLIAAQFAVHLRRTLYLHKIAYNEDYSYLSPGNILFLKTLERAFSSMEIDEVNCITDMHWHRNWNMSKRKYFDISVYPKKMVPQMFYFTTEVVPNFAKRLPGVMKVWKFFKSRRHG